MDKDLPFEEEWISNNESIRVFKSDELNPSEYLNLMYSMKSLSGTLMRRIGLFNV
jgi:hypothetical protein